MPDIRTTSPAAPALKSPSQQRFNNLFLQISKEKQRLLDWQAVTRQFQQRCASEFNDLAAQIDACNTKVVLLLDKAHADKRLGKRQRAKLEDIVAEMTSDLVERGDNADIQRLYEAYNGIDVSDDLDDLDDPDDDADDFFDLFDLPDELAEAGEAEPPKARKKTARQRQREQADEKVERAATHAVRDVYRALVSALHPDREKDSAERQRKNGLMQRVNAAYAANNLLALLELQLEIEQIDQAAINSLGEERLQHYNRVLARQLDEVRQEVRDEIFVLEIEYCLEPRFTRSPKAALGLLDAEAASLREQLAQCESDLAQLQDIKGVKAWLNKVELSPFEDGFGDFDEFLAFSRLFDASR